MGFEGKIGDNISLDQPSFLIEKNNFVDPQHAWGPLAAWIRRLGAFEAHCASEKTMPNRKRAETESEFNGTIDKISALTHPWSKGVSSAIFRFLQADVAQLVERRIRNAQVAGSTPAVGS